MIGGLYAITPECADTESLVEQVRQALSGGAHLVQYRNKGGDVGLRHEQASELLALCKQFHVPLIINDDIRLSDLTGADGVHLGKDDGSVREARLILGPDKIIGVSCYNDLQRALDAEAHGANYVAFGSFFPSSTKSDVVTAPLTLLHEAKRVLNIPLVSIGGITADNVTPLIEAGTDAVAVISALFDSEDIVRAASRFAVLFEKSNHHTLH
ncbi:thiamine monophosphate synthase [Sulfuricella denitrificans skB26]|uniref:Thiamine-phosphate synthase n=1 Tax=Sulfuricella denitrificans (strain DSM 22764 / NBRC 105220 / skB26) TaxID=1163617 RepID=S6B8T4_SULDS|nr:thiamine phosphate synthase [Sulfuricella denitrificans]BAN36727.1 thiamine monophosphate synthase [Sulfuricella denitrificans skB26]